MLEACDRFSEKRSAEIVDQHGLTLFLAGLVEGDGAAIGRGSEPEGDAVEHGDGGGAAVAEIKKAEHRAMTERRANK